MSVRTIAGQGTGKHPRICLYSMHAVNLYRLHPTGGVGGAEVQYSLLARELASDLDVHIVTLAPLPPDDVVVPPGHVLHLIDVPRGRSGFVWVARVILDKWKAFRRADPTVVMQRGAGLATFAVALWAKVARRPFIYHWASDANVRGPITAEAPMVPFLYRLGRRWARRQLCQTEDQWRMLPSNEQARAVVVPNVLDDRIGWRRASGTEVLWVGTIRAESKRPDLFLELAASLPRRRFRMVGELIGTPAFKEAFRRQLATVQNVTVVGFVERQALPAQFDHARCLVNTSDLEGFPNTFLEACASGVPVVSRRVDPDGLLRRRGAGIVCDDDPRLLRDAVESMFNDAVWSRHRAAALVAVERHRPAAAAARIREILAEVQR